MLIFQDIRFQLATLLFTIFCVYGATAQQVGGFEKLTIEDGLSQGFITYITQDKEGFLWIGTSHGLNRYDGREIRIFTNDPLDPYSIASNWIKGVKDLGDYILVELRDGNLNIFDKRTQKFYLLGNLESNLPKRDFGDISNLFIDSENTVWVVENNTNLIHLTINKRTGVEMPVLRIIKEIRIDNSSQLSFTELNESQDRIWLLSRQLLLSVDKKTGQVKQHISNQTDLRTLLIAPDRSVWIGGVNKIGKHAQGKVTWIETDFITKYLEYDPLKNQILAGAEKRLLVFDAAELDLPFLSSSKGEELLSIDKGIFNLFFKDRSGILWVGTNGYGVRKYNRVLHRFQNSYTNFSIYTPLHIDPEGNTCFIITSNTFLFSRQGMSEKHSLYKLRNLIDRNSLSRVDENGDYWFVTPKSPEGKKFMFYKLGAQKPADWQLVTSIPFDTLIDFTIFRENPRYMWLAYQPGIYRINLLNLKTDFFEYKNLLPDKVWINSMTKSDNGIFWIATSHGLIMASPTETGFDFELLTTDPGNEQALLSNDVSCLLLDQADSSMLWIATRGGGLTKLDTKTMRYRHFYTRSGFPNDVVYSLLFDDAGLLWISTNSGIVRLNPATEKIRQYTVEDGLATNEFNQNAVGRKPDGTFVFGGVKGLASFLPADFSDNQVVPKVCITGLDINNQRIHYGDSTGILDQSIEFTKQLTLPFTQNNITLHFVGLEFTIPAKNKFKYYLEGAESPWSHISTENQASYLNLSPGNYTFFIKASNSDGIWNEVPVELNITILPPWYRSTTAYILYILALAALAYGVLKFVLHRQRLQDRLQMEHREAERLKELDAFKSRVFTNITHEFRTPLTVIQGMAGELEKYDPDKPVTTVKKSANIIRRNGAELLRMINQLLDLAKLEANSMVLKPEPTNLVSFVKYLAASFQSLAVSKGIQLEIESTEGEIPTKVDKDQVQTIISNLLSNAIKFTPQGGQINLSIHRSSHWQDGANSGFYKIVQPKELQHRDWAIIRVRDNGVGIPEDQLQNVFDQFYQVDNAESRQGKGTGIGLALVKELLILKGGGLVVNSKVGQGTDFIVSLLVRPVDASIQEPLIASGSSAPVEVQSTTPNQIKSNKNLPTVLIIEDNSDVLDYLSMCLENTYRTQRAKDGQAGIDAALESIPDIIVSDVMMPHKDGYEVVKTLKNDERTSHIPIVLLTARADLDSRIQGLKRGADAYLAKPFDKEELLTYLENLLKQRQHLHERYASGVLVHGGTWTKNEQDLQLEDTFIQKVQDVLAENMQDEDFDVPSLCKAINMSRAQLHRKLTALTGKSATRYIRTVRLHKARQLLLSSDKTVSEVAFEVGFRHLQHFSSSFTAEFGQSPSSLRK